MINSIQTEISYWVVKRSYSVKRIDGLEYIIPDEDIPLTIANPLEHEKRLLCDALNLGRRLKENEPRFHSAMVLDFVSKYGLLGIMTDITNTDMNAYD